eukprot:TRINITY_DN71878_c0_g1_i1.p1 TRINITY_DN71878_c0_g1~~TRINITY_DN71878_c0_g1_i1.p1  ORF type:complete len:484 (-),score=104.25 TRINITY_DN71878_c0_g1_i1:14-1390(-)
MAAAMLAVASDAEVTCRNALELRALLSEGIPVAQAPASMGLALRGLASMAELRTVSSLLAARDQPERLNLARFLAGRCRAGASLHIDIASDDLVGACSVAASSSSVPVPDAARDAIAGAAVSSLADALASCAEDGGSPSTRAAVTGAHGEEGQDGSDEDMFDIDFDSLGALDGSDDGAIGTDIKGESASDIAATDALNRQVEDERGLLSSIALINCFEGVPASVLHPLWRALPAGLADLDLSANALSDHAVSALCGALLQQRRCPTRLVLRANHCKDIDRLCALIECGGRLEVLDLEDNSLNDKSAVQLVEALGAPATRLRWLSLSRNRRLSSRGLGRFAGSLAGPGRSGRSLRTLRMDGTGFCDDGVIAFAAALREGSDVKELSMLQTRLTSAGAHMLLEAAALGTAVAKDNLCALRLVLDDAVESVSWRRCSDPIQLLDLCEPLGPCDAPCLGVPA